MSYILDALKKSETERQQGKAPGVNTIQAVESFQRKRRSIWPHVAAIALILNVGFVVVALWLWDHREQASPPSSELTGRAELGTEEESPPDPSAKSEAAPPSPPVQTVSHPEIPTSAGEGGVPLPASTPPPTAMPAAQPDPGGTSAATSASPPQNETAVPESSTPAASPSNSAPDPSPGPGDKRAAPIRFKSFTKPADQAGPVTSVTPPSPGGKAQRTRQPDEANTGPSAAMTPPSAGTTLAPPEISGHRGKLPSLDATPPRKQRGENASRFGEDGPVDLHDLPPTVRNEVPRLSVSFLVFSSQPEDRMVTINGKRMREGEEVSEGLRLEEITPDGVILTWRGTRFHKGVF